MSLRSVQPAGRGSGVNGGGVGVNGVNGVSCCSVAAPRCRRRRRTQAAVIHHHRLDIGLSRSLSLIERRQLLDLERRRSMSRLVRRRRRLDLAHRRRLDLERCRGSHGAIGRIREWKELAVDRWAGALEPRSRL